MNRIASNNVVPNIENFPLVTPKCKLIEEEVTDSQQKEVTEPGGCVGA
jgi:hypothetical protein